MIDIAYRSWIEAIARAIRLPDSRSYAASKALYTGRLESLPTIDFGLSKIIL